MTSNGNYILVTGTNGFVGRSLCAEAVARSLAVIGATRTACNVQVGVKQNQ